MMLKGGIVTLNSYHGQLPGFQKTHHNVCTFNKRQFLYSRISENSLEARVPGSNSRSTFFTRYKSHLRSKGKNDIRTMTHTHTYM